MRIGVYVGSFNPVHKGHISIVNHLLNKDYLDKVIIIPTLNYWNKLDLIDVKHRINMLKFYETDNILINDTLNSKEYTYEILNSLKSQYEFDTIYLIIGADNLVDFHLWKNIDNILENKVIVINRDNIDVKKYIDNFKNKDNFIVVNDFKCIDISSTDIRVDLSTNKDSVDKCVYDYIVKNGLYK